jgi:DNA topoisomerase-3
MVKHLNRPEIRAAIESDCQRIARGELDKAVAVMRCLETMKRCFVTCCSEASKLDQAVEKYYVGLGAGSEEQYTLVHRNLSSCGVCHEGMELRIEKTNRVDDKDPKRFLFCKHCKKSYILPLRGELLQHELSCVICQFQVLIVRNTETNRDHTICPYCFSNPPPPPDGLDNLQDFRCFSCARSDCTLAQRLTGSETAIAPCYEERCQGHIHLRKNNKGLIAACNSSGCKSIWWLPRFVKSGTVTTPCRLLVILYAIIHLIVCFE